jgi:hypothetical protein
MEQVQRHGGYEATRRTDGDLAKKIQHTLAQLELVPLDWRDELWAAAWGGAVHANTLLAEGRRAKAGVVHARARRIIEGN